MLWLDRPVGWQSSHEPGPNDYNYDEMTAKQRKMIREPFLFWYHADWDYGHTTLEFFGVAVALSALLYVAFLFRAKRPQTSGRGIVARAGGFLRYFTARQFYYRSVLGDWYSPPLGAIIAVVGVFIFIMGLMLAKRPYYWPNEEMGHSQPIATRSGWIAIAMIPFMIVLGTKVNYIAMLTGTSHEKLQVFHRWLGAIMLIPSLVHTFPFIVMEIRMGTMQNTWKTSSFYWTGTAALVPLGYLVFTSWGIFRNKNYELFKKLHFIAAGIFMVALFIHCDWILTSWHYFWATLALYSTSYLFRFGRTLYTSGLSLTAHVSVLPSSPGAPLLHVRIPVPHRVSWKPGQHVFIRFWGLGMPHAFSSHPWTVYSLPTTTEGGVKAMEVVMRVKGGITAELARRAMGKTGFNIKVWVDGPYGGVPGGLGSYDDVVLMAGGSGSSFVIPLLAEFAVRKPEAGQHVHLIVAVRDRSDYSWMEPTVSNAVHSLGIALSVHIHITGDSTISATDEDVEKDEKSSKEGGAPLFVHGRPRLPAVVHDMCEEARGKVAIVACGPDSFLYDVRNAVAEKQLTLLQATGGATDIFLHTETYSW